MTSAGARSHFDVVRPRSGAEAVRLKEAHGSGAWFWAGGTDLTLMWQRRQVSPITCIDLSALSEFRDLKVDRHAIRIGALVTLADLERSAGKHGLLAVLSDVAKLMCTPQTRSIATVGGNLCNASPAADLSPCLVALDSEVRLLGPSGTRSLLLESFFAGVKRTTIGTAEMMTEVHISLPGPHLAVSYRRVARTVVDIALVNASSSLLLDDKKRVSRARVALGAVAPVIIRSAEAESMLLGRPLGKIDDGLLEAVGQRASEDANPISDVRAGADYRRKMVKVLVKRSIGDCVARLGG